MLYGLRQLTKFLNDQNFDEAPRIKKFEFQKLPIMPILQGFYLQNCGRSKV